MKKLLRQILVLSLLSLSVWMIPTTSYADGAETFADAVTILDTALETGESTKIADLIHPDNGLDILGQDVAADEFLALMLDDDTRTFEVYKGGGMVPTESSFFTLLWEPGGAFRDADDVALAHFEIVNRDELLSEEITFRWEHGELETAVVVDNEEVHHLYILPDISWRFSFTEIEGSWFFTGIALRENLAAS